MCWSNRSFNTPLWQTSGIWLSYNYVQGVGNLTVKALLGVGNLTFIWVGWGKLNHKMAGFRWFFVFLFFWRGEAKLLTTVALRDMPFASNLRNWNFTFRNLKFRACKLQSLSLGMLNFQFWKISCFETQSYEFANSKFWVSKLKISSYSTQNFAFRNSKFRVCKLEI